MTTPTNLINVFGDLALETTLADLLTIFQERTGPFGKSHLMTGSQNRFRKEFNVPLNIVDTWDVVVTGAGASQSVSGGMLQITSGTAATGDVQVISKERFTAPCRVMVSLGLSSRQANQESYVELVAIDPDTGLLDETRRMALRSAAADSATTTTIAYESQNGSATPVRTAVANTTVPNVGATPIALWELELESDECWFHTRLPDSTVGRALSVVRQTVSPDPSLEYVLRIRQRNSAAVATPATLRVGHVLVSDYTEIQAEISGSRGSANAGQALPVIVNGTTVVSGAVSAGPQSTGTTTWTPRKVLSAASTNAVQLIAAAAVCYGFTLANRHATDWRFLKFYNVASGLVVGTTVPFMTFPLRPGDSAPVNFTPGVRFSTGLAIAITANPDDLDSTPIGAGDVVGTIYA